MKKFIASAAAVAMAATMAVSVFAASGSGSVTAENGTQDIKVEAKYEGNTTTPDVVSASIAWGSMQFVYSKSGQNIWNPENHTYDNSDHTSGWNQTTGNTVTVTNHSNIDVSVDFKYTKDTTNTNDLTGSFKYSKTAEANGSIKLKAGEVNKADTADSVVATLTLDGVPAETMTTFTEVGKITVTIKK